MSSKKGILYGRTSWSEECRGGVYEKDKEGYFNDNKYEGEIENGKPHGNGIWTMVNGATYVGQFVNGFREGFGTFTWSIHAPDGGGVYEGEYKNNRRNGKGIRTRSDGSKEDGIWKDNKLWNGTIYEKDGTIIIKFEDGEPKGLGSKTYPRS